MIPPPTRSYETSLRPILGLPQAGTLHVDDGGNRPPVHLTLQLDDLLIDVDSPRLFGFEGVSQSVLRPQAPALDVTGPYPGIPPYPISCK